MNGYIYRLIDNVIVIVIEDVRVVGLDSLEGSTSAAAGIDTNLAGIFVTATVLKVGDKISGGLTNHSEKFVKKSASDILEQRLADVELIMADLLGI